MATDRRTMSVAIVFRCFAPILLQLPVYQSSFSLVALGGWSVELCDDVEAEEDGGGSSCAS